MRPMTRPVQVLHVVKGLGPGGAERLLVSLAGASDPSAVRHQVAYILPWKDHLVASCQVSACIATSSVDVGASLILVGCHAWPASSPNRRRTSSTSIRRRWRPVPGRSQEPDPGAQGSSRPSTTPGAPTPS